MMMAMKDSYHIFGRKPIIEALKESPKSVVAVYVKDSVKDAAFEEIRGLAKREKIAINSVDERKLDELAGAGANHQGVVADMKPFAYAEFGAWLEAMRGKETATLLILDRIQDVQNFGAIARSAAAFGADAILVGEHDQAPVTSAAWKASAGMISKIPVIQAGNLNVAIDKLKDERFWVVGLAGDGEMPIGDYEQDAKLAIVLGSEGEGLREKTRERCDTVLSIPMAPSVESLNASVSAAIALYERMRFLRSR